MSYRPKTADLGALIEALVAAKIEMIVVGGVAAVLHGAPVTTHDLDIVYSCNLDNLAHLQALLEQLDAIIREPGERERRPTIEMLDGSGQLRLMTSLGPLDLLGKLHDGRDYEALQSSSVTLVDGNLRLRVVDLDTLIQIKSTTGRARDRIVVPMLMALRDQNS